MYWFTFARPGPVGALRQARRVAAVAAVAAAFALAPAGSASAKTFDLVGTVDCGRASGERCEVGDTITLRTKDLSGVLETVEIDVSWIRRDVEGADQDDFLRFEVEEKPGGGYQALRTFEPDEQRRRAKEDDVQNGQHEDEEEEEEEEEEQPG